MTTRPQGAADGERRRDSPMFGTRRGYLTLALLTAVYAHSALCQYLIGACATELEADVGLSPQGLGFALLVGPAFTFSKTVAAAPLTRRSLAPRLGSRRRLLAACCLAWSLATASSNAKTVR